MRHMKAGRTFNRDTNARKALFVGLAKNLIEKEQIKTTLPKAKDLRRVVEKLITRAKEDTVANRRLVASELGNSSAATVKKLFDVLGKRYANRPGGYTRVLKAGFRYGDAAPMAIIDKRRPKPNVAEAMNIIGDVEGKDVIVVEDIIDTGRTLNDVCKHSKMLAAVNGWPNKNWWQTLKNPPTGGFFIAKN